MYYTHRWEITFPHSSGTLSQQTISKMENRHHIATPPEVMSSSKFKWRRRDGHMAGTLLSLRVSQNQKDFITHKSPQWCKTTDDTDRDSLTHVEESENQFDEVLYPAIYQDTDYGGKNVVSGQHSLTPQRYENMSTA